MYFFSGNRCLKTHVVTTCILQWPYNPLSRLLGIEEGLLGLGFLFCGMKVFA